MTDQPTQDAIVTQRDNSDGKHSNLAYSDLHWAADAIERGDFGAGEGKLA